MITQPTDTARDGIMRTLAVTEQIASTLPVLPYAVNLTTDYRGGYGIDLHFRQPDYVAQFAEAYGVEAVTREFSAKDPRDFTSVHVTVSDVPVHGWHLADAEPTAVAS